MIKSPIAYIVFNRPKHTEKTFAVLRKQMPSQLFIIADGPRSGHSTDAERCAAVREIVEDIDWPCVVYRNYADTNLGLKQRVSSGLDWVFKHVDRAIVLEDDCLANPDFFHFCENLLEHYQYDERVVVITGNNFQNGRKHGNASYYFSKYNHCWGWATWRRAWSHYDGAISFWPEWRKSKNWSETTPDKIERRYWENIFNRIHNGKIDSWAYPWIASVWHKGGLTATPNVNLVSNIGFGQESTHTKSEDHFLSKMNTFSLAEISHPNIIKKNIEADRYVFEYAYGGKKLRFPWNLINFPNRIINYILKITIKK